MFSLKILAIGLAAFGLLSALTRVGWSLLDRGAMLQAVITNGAPQAIPDNTLTTVIFPIVARDTATGYNAGTGRYTVQAGKDGDYLIVAQVQWDSGNNAGTAWLMVYKNGGLLRRSIFNQGGGVDVFGGDTQSIETIENLAAGDIIDIRVQEITGVASQIGSVGTTNNFFSLKQLL